MKIISRYLRTTVTISIIISLIFLLTKCIHKNEENLGIITNSFGKKFAGSSTCINCHKNIYESQLHTAHFLTSGIAERKNILGSFKTDSNKYIYDTAQVVAMEQEDSSYYQVAFINGMAKEAHRFDIVIGSGTMGQSYLSWKNNYLFQLPITYFTAANQWSNSPGYPKKIIFNRPITSRCLECHSTYAQTLSEPTADIEAFDRSKIIYGVDCEKCHGAAAEHVAFQTQNPTVTKAQFIINPARLSRQQNLDLCASCHGGRLQKTKPSFGFTVGDKLSDYFVVDTTAPDPDHIDVHGNQYGLLRASKCFRMSETMSCNTCHNSHEMERGKTALFSQRCMSCHSLEHRNFCTLKNISNNLLKSNCVDCHMPLKSSRAIAVFLPGGTVPIAAMIRSHLIKIYPEETKRMLVFIYKK